MNKLRWESGVIPHQPEVEVPAEQPERRVMGLLSPFVSIVGLCDRLAYRYHTL